MLLDIYKLIDRIQKEIGNNAEVIFSLHDEQLEICVNWWDADYHARRVLPEIELAKMQSDEQFLGYFIEWCKRAYERLEHGK